jgi:hypothetical protein
MKELAEEVFIETIGEGLWRLLVVFLSGLLS